MRKRDSKTAIKGKSWKECFAITEMGKTAGISLGEVRSPILQVNSRFLLEIQIDIISRLDVSVESRDEGAEWTSGSHQHKDGLEGLRISSISTAVREEKTGPTQDPGAPNTGRLGRRGSSRGGRRGETTEVRGERTHGS